MRTSQPREGEQLAPFTLLIREESGYGAREADWARQLENQTPVTKAPSARDTDALATCTHALMTSYAVRAHTLDTH